MVVFVIRDIFIKEEVIQVEKVEEYYNGLPNKYDPNTWPKYTELQCYNCTLTSKRIPIFIPVSRSSSGVLQRGGGPIFCCVPCMFRTILDRNLDSTSRKKSMDLVADLVKKISGKDMGLPIPAGDRGTLKRYGGNKSDYEFQAEILKFCPYIENFYANSYDFIQDCK